MCAAVGLSVLGAGVALPAAPASSQVNPVRESSSATVEYAAVPDAVRLGYGVATRFFLRANDEVTYRFCEYYNDQNCDVQTTTCGTAVAVLGRINERAYEARRLLIDRGVREVTEGDGATPGVPRADVRLEHLLEKLLENTPAPVLPLRYRFLNPEVDLPDRDYDTVNRVAVDVPADPLYPYRDPALTTELENAAGDRDNDGDTDRDDVADYIDALTDVAAFDGLYNRLPPDAPKYLQGRLSDEKARLDTLATEITNLTTEIGLLPPGDQDRIAKEQERSAKEAERDTLLGQVREALHVDPDDWPEHVHATLALLRRYLDRGLGHRPEGTLRTGYVGRKFFLLEDIPNDLLMMDHHRYRGGAYHLWPWSRDHWTGGFQQGFLEFLGVALPDLSPIRPARVRRERSAAPVYATRPADVVVRSLVSHCRRWHIPADRALREVGSGYGKADASRVFAALRKPTGPADDRIVFADRDYAVLVRDASEENVWWAFPLHFAQVTPGFWGVQIGSGSDLRAMQYWLRLPVAGAHDDRYIHASYLTLRHDSGTDGIEHTADDRWEFYDGSDGSDSPVHTMTHSAAGNPFRQSPTRSGVEAQDMAWSETVGDWVPGGATRLVGRGLGEVSWDYCLNPTPNDSGDAVCELPWTRLAVMVEPDGWDEARAWGKDDAFRLLMDFDSGQVALLHEVDTGSVTLENKTYEVVERVCCLSDGSANWSFGVELPVMDNDTVRFFKENTVSGHLESIDRHGAVVAAANLTASDEAACAGSRYCTFVRPRAKGGVSSGHFGLTVRPFATALELEVSAPGGLSTVTSETRTFEYCLAHRAEDCDTSGGRLCGGDVCGGAAVAERSGERAGVADRGHRLAALRGEHGVPRHASRRVVDHRRLQQDEHAADRRGGHPRTPGADTAPAARAQVLQELQEGLERPEREGEDLAGERLGGGPRQRAGRARVVRPAREGAVRSAISARPHVARVRQRQRVHLQARYHILLDRRQARRDQLEGLLADEVDGDR